MPMHSTGTQLMSYGKGTGEAYLSAITIAYMEDTGHYVAASSSGGSMVRYPCEMVLGQRTATFASPSFV
jgi:hypothetical protein